MTQPLIAVDHIFYSHPVPGGAAIPALSNVSLTIEEGEFVAIVGANGSGKTTLARHLNGLHLPEQGSVKINGLDTREKANLAQIRTLVGMVFQNPQDQLIATVLEEDVAFGPENLGLPAAEIHLRVEEALQITGLSAHRDRAPHMLSAGQMQRAALAGVLAMRPRCVIFDETTAMLDPGGRRMVRDLIQRLHASGLTVIVISHFMREAVNAGRVIALDHGAIAYDGPARQFFYHSADLERLGLDLPQAGRLANQLRGVLPQLPADILTSKELFAALPEFPFQPAASHFSDPSRQAVAGDPWLQVSGLSHTYLRGTPLAHVALKEVDLQANAHAAHGLIGATGTGKSTLLQHLNGLLLPQTGQVKVGPFDMNDPQTDLRAVRRFAGLVFQNPDFQLFEQYVGDEIAYAPRLKGESTHLREIVREAMTVVGLDFDAFKDRLTFTLSGGEKRKVALASVLAMQPEILLLDEPTAGLDPLARRAALATLGNLRSDHGTTLLLSSHHMEDIAELCSAVTVLDQGRTALAGAAEHVFNQIEALAAIGLEPPLAVETAAQLRQKGWPLPPAITRPEELTDALLSASEAGRG